MAILNLTRNTILSTKVTIAQTTSQRMQGLLGRKSMGLDEALVIFHCQAIHMFFMNFSIDVIFVGKENRVVGLVENIQPFHLSPIFWRADKAIEVAPGTIKSSLTSLFDLLVIEGQAN